MYHVLSPGKDDNDTFFATYRVMTFVFHFLSIYVFYYFLTQIELKRMALFGAIIFSVMPAMLMAYNTPVHTREDTLGYALLSMGLLMIIKNKVGLF